MMMKRGRDEVEVERKREREVLREGRKGGRTVT